MADADFSDELRAFIHDAIPSLDAAELLVMIAREPQRTYAVSDAVEAMRPTVLTDQTASRYLMHFEARGLVAAAGAGMFRYAPANGTLDRLVHELVRVFNERPVTLVRVIYASGDEKIRSFADAFRIKK